MAENPNLNHSFFNILSRASLVHSGVGDEQIDLASEKIFKYKLSHPQASSDQFNQFLQSDILAGLEGSHASSPQTPASLREFSAPLADFDLNASDSLFRQQVLASTFAVDVGPKAGNDIAASFVNSGLDKTIYGLASHAMEPDASVESRFTSQSVAAAELTRLGIGYLADSGFIPPPLVPPLLQTNLGYEHLYPVIHESFGPRSDNVTSSSSTYTHVPSGSNNPFVNYVFGKAKNKITQKALTRFTSSQTGKKVAAELAKLGIKLGTKAVAQTAATAAGTVGGGATTGAAVGAAGGPVGIVIGAVVGFVVGLIPAAIKFVKDHSGEFLAGFWQSLGGKINQLPTLASRSLGLFYGILASSIIAIFSPLIILLFAVPLLIIFIVLIINNSAYVVPYTNPLFQTVNTVDVSPTLGPTPPGGGYGAGFSPGAIACVIGDLVPNVCPDLDSCAGAQNYCSAYGDACDPGYCAGPQLDCPEFRFCCKHLITATITPTPNP